MRAHFGKLFNSLTIRIVLLLTLGMACASVVSIVITESTRDRAYQHAQLEGLANVIADIDHRFLVAPETTDALLKGRRIFGLRQASPQWRMTRHNVELESLLRARLNPNARAQAMRMKGNACLPTENDGINTEIMVVQSAYECWYVIFHDSHGVERQLGVDISPVPSSQHSLIDPVFFSLILIASAALAAVVAKIVTAPLKRLKFAAQAFSLTTPPHSLPEEGPEEVRSALQTFNIMQNRVLEGFKERTRLLAAIAHDIQTPLTRLRLRVEQVEDEGLRERLIGDIARTLQLVRNGLDLARSSESQEAWSQVEVDTVLSSLAEDMAEFGNDVQFTKGCGAQALVRPNALIRCLTNLVDNAVKYADGAEVSAELAGDEIRVFVRDHGPGIPEIELAEALRPYRRLQSTEHRAPGTGIGLTIAQLQAQTFGANLKIENHPDGGLLAVVAFSRLSGKADAS